MLSGLNIHYYAQTLYFVIYIDHQNILHNLIDNYSRIRSLHKPIYNWYFTNKSLLNKMEAYYKHGTWKCRITQRHKGFNLIEICQILVNLHTFDIRHSYLAPQR